MRGRARACMSVHVSALAPVQRRLARFSRALLSRVAPEPCPGVRPARPRIWERFALETVQSPGLLLPANSVRGVLCCSTKEEANSVFS